MKVKQTLISLGVLITICGAAMSLPAYAATCGGQKTSILSCSQGGDGKCNDGTIISSADIAGGKTKCPDGSSPAVVENSGIWGILLVVINILTAGVGILAVGGIIYGSILYTSSGGNPENTKKAITFITNVVIGIVAYGAMFSLLNFIIPGGLFT
jgi:hypothetical protein